MILLSDTNGSLIALDIIKTAIKNDIKVPDAAIFIYPCPKLIINELTFLNYDPFIFFEDNMTESSQPQSKLQDILLDLEETSKYTDDDRLNFFLTESKFVSVFPQVFIISSGNEPVIEDCRNLVDFLRYFIYLHIGNIMY